MEQPTGGCLDQFHRWYYDSGVWEAVQFLGVPCLKSVMDMWNYQEVLFELQPSLILEFGTRHGGSALYFSLIGRRINPELRVLTVDIEAESLHPRAKADTSIEFMICSSTDPRVAERVRQLRQQYPGPMFAILDSDHRMGHVLDELLSLRDITVPGDYVVVEDGNINGHPVLPDWGPGPFEAVEAYFDRYPHDYVKDAAREAKFGFTFAPNGFLRRI